LADLSDVTAYLAQQAYAAVYPNGSSQPSVAGMDCLVFEGWPVADQLDLDVNGKMKDASGLVIPRPGGPRANVSIFPMMGTGVQVYQILDETYTIAPPAITLTVSISGPPVTVSGGGTIITLGGQPAVGEYLTLVCDDQHIFSSGGATTAALISALAAQASAIYPGTSSTATTLTVPVNAYLTVRQGGTAVMGKVTHRQRHCIMVTVWAPNRVARNQFAAAIDGLIKQNNRVSLPDTSQALVIYSRTNTIDDQQAETIYRRDLIYDVDYATVEQFPGYVITSTTTSIVNAYSTSTIATAIT
jgi:hypothetical protein